MAGSNRYDQLVKKIRIESDHFVLAGIYEFELYFKKNLFKSRPAKKPGLAKTRPSPAQPKTCRNSTKLMKTQLNLRKHG
jgi:hypothetical protein